jgi:hypothetical protein
MLITAALMVPSALLLFAILMLADQRGAAIGILIMLLALAGLLALYQTAMEHFIEGVNMVIDACKCAPTAKHWLDNFHAIFTL